MDFSKRCEECDLCKYATNQCVPKGASENVNIYFIGEAPGREEDKEGIPFVGKAGQHLHRIIGDFGLNENNCRFFNVVRCYPQKSDTDTGFRAPNDNEVNNCIINLLMDIKKSKPKVIMPLGNTALKALVEDASGGITKNRGKIIEYGEYVLVPSYHPSYLVRQSDNTKIHNEFISDIKTAVNLCLSDNIHDEVNKSKESKKDNLSKTIPCLTYDEFDRFCKEYIDPYDDIMYDTETNAKEPHSEDFRLVGFSSASSKDVGCYVVIKSLDYSMEDSDVEKVKTRLKDILETKNITVYNCQYEIPVAMNTMNADIHRIDDIFVLVKLMMGNADEYQGNGGLKAQSVMNLGYFDWSEDLDTYFNLLVNLDKDSNEEKMKVLMSKYYEGYDLDNIMDRINSFYYDELPYISYSKTLSYEYVPYKLISRYGSIDSSIMFELRDFYYEWMDREGKNLGIDLYQGYKYWMMHHIAGSMMESNGAYWNDEKATIVEKWCSDGLRESLKMLVSSPLSESYIRNKKRQDFIRYIRDNYVAEVLGPGVIPKRLWKNTMDVIVNSDEARNKLARMSVIPNDKGVCKLQLGHIETLSKKFLHDNPQLENDWFSDYMKSYLEEDHTVDEYKTLINPNATSADFRLYVSNLLLTPEVRYAKVYFELRKITEEPNFSMDMFNGDSRDLMELIENLRTDNEITEYDKFNKFVKAIDSADISNNRTIKNVINMSLSYELGSLDAKVMNEIYDLYLMCGNDVESSETWNDEFRWLFNYKMFKKYSKILSTYINGKVGRKNVYYVDKESLENGDKLTRRKSLYNSDIDNKGKSMLLQQDFKINQADSGRWKSGIHNLPAGEAVKQIYTSRFPGGCIGMPDGSQMEVRTLAAECKDENLLKAFKDGLDIHRYFASLIYSVDYDEVLDWQRGLAKNAVFGMIYGESEKAFADLYLKGDMKKAHEVFEGMFNGFPRIKEFIERAQDQYERYNKVTTLTQRYMILDNPIIDHNTMKRKASNYPIQGSAEDIAGVILYKLCEYLKENNFKSKPFCFIHDSIEIDFHPDEVFQLIDKINWLFNEYPLEEFGVPVACDVPIGPSMGQECEMVDLVHNDDYNEVEITLKGFIDDIDELIEIWKGVYRVAEYVNEYEYKKDDKESYMPWSKAFLPSKAQISMLAGKTRYKGKRKIHVICK